MDLSGHHSNPPAALEGLLGGAYLASLVPRRGRPGSLTRPSATGNHRVGTAHPRQGRIVDAIVSALRSRGEPMRARDVHAQIEVLLGEPVRLATVKATLAGNLEGPAPRFVRVSRGRYEVSPAPCPRPTPSHAVLRPSG